MCLFLNMISTNWLMSFEFFYELNKKKKGILVYLVLFYVWWQMEEAYLVYGRCSSCLTFL